MKNFKIVLSAILVLVSLGFTSCEQEGNENEIEGKYTGTFSILDKLEAAPSEEDFEGNGTAEITITGSNQIEVHCNGEAIDTSFMLDYYGHNDSVYVCLRGEEFEETYGHALGHGHMGGNRMGDIADGETEWRHHYNNEHQKGDEHFGGFNMQDMTFTYSFMMNKDSSSYYLKFHGSKE